MSQVASLGHPPATLAENGRRTRILWWIMLVCSLGVAVYSTRYFILPTQDAHFARYLVLLRFHVAGGMGALLSGPWQFSAKLRSRALNTHRWLGRFHLLSVALGSIAGVAMRSFLQRACPLILVSESLPSSGSSQGCKPIA